MELAKYPNGKQIKEGDLVILNGRQRKYYQTSVDFAVVVSVRSNSILIARLLPSRFKWVKDKTQININRPTRSISTKTRGKIFNDVYSTLFNTSPGWMFVEMSTGLDDDKLEKAGVNYENFIYFLVKTYKEELPEELEIAYNEVQEYLKSKRNEFTTDNN